MINAPHEIQTALTTIKPGQRIKASVSRHGDGSVTINIPCKKETVRVNFDTLSEAEAAGWPV